MASPPNRRSAPAASQLSAGQSGHNAGQATALVRDGQPLYRQLADDLRDRIHREEFAVGSPIPTEAQLSHDYRASRITVRHALGMLEQEGLLHREQGRGSFIRPRALSVGPRRLTSFSEELDERGLRHGTDLVSVEDLSVSPDTPLDLAPDGRCVRIERVRKADGRAIAHQVTYVPIEFGVGIGAALQGDGSLYAFLRTQHALDIDSADETYRVGAADTTSAAILEVPIREPVFVVERVGFAGARRVEWTLSTVRGEGYEVHVHLRR